MQTEILVDRNFYNKGYKGLELVDLNDDEFEHYMRKAENKIHKYTFNRSQIYKPWDVPANVRDCICDVADTIYKYSESDSLIAQEKREGWTVNYERGGQTLEQLIRSKIEDHLSGTNLLSYW